MHITDAYYASIALEQVTYRIYGNREFLTHHPQCENIFFAR